MSTIIYIVLAVLMFGVFIFIHEFGHYFFARLFNVSITEFSIGMSDDYPFAIEYGSTMVRIGSMIFGARK